MTTTLASDAAGLARAAEEIRAAPRVAVDTEFHAERRYLPRLYLIQVHVHGGGTWILDPLDEATLPAVSEPLRSTPWVVHGGTQDLRLLLPALGGLPDTILDTQVAAGLVQEVYPASYAHLQARIAGRDIPKGATLSDWGRRPLSPQQLAYAAEDVTLLLDLWDRIEARLTELGRRELAEAACAEARERVVDPRPDDLIWREIHAVSFLDPHQAAVAAELAAWREETARRGNQPPRSLLPDGLLADLARTQPSTVGGLAANRRLSKGLVRKHGNDLVERIARARRRPEWAWPHPVAPTSPEARVVRWLQCLAEALGHERHFAQRLVLPQSLAEDLALLERPERAAVDAALGWRAELIGAEVHQALQGTLAVHLSGGDLRASPWSNDGVG